MKALHLIVFLFWVTQSPNSFAQPSLQGAQKENFYDLRYSGKTANKTTIGTDIKISVNQSASPLFYKVGRKVKRIDIAGRISIEKPINNFTQDSYIAVGTAYAGDLRPNFFQRLIMPDWILKVNTLIPDQGLGPIDFHEASPENIYQDSQKSALGIEFTRKTVTKIQPDGSFSLEIIPKNTDILGLWIRADGDDSKAQFSVTITDFKITEANSAN